MTARWPAASVPSALPHACTWPIPSQVWTPPCGRATPPAVPPSSALLSRRLAAVPPFSRPSHILPPCWYGPQDYWHHVEDVCAGFVLGLFVAFCYYR